MSTKTINALNPAVAKPWLWLLSGSMWAAIGVFLCSLTVAWLRPLPTVQMSMLVLSGLVLAFLIFRFGFSGFALHNIDRIHAIPRQKVCIFAFQKWTSYPLVAFMIGCSYSFEWALLQAGIRLRHIELEEIVSVYFTSKPCKPAGIFEGPMVTSMRPIKRDQLVRAVQICSRFPAVHGAPVQVGNPADIGVDLNKPDFGWKPEIPDDEVPVFWGCGVTPQAVEMKAKVDFMITHSPGHMFITDILSEAFAVI